ncbi:DinB family protein [Aestuariibaculum suncheonense]|uniref:DinB family protein n=1 Tax=Aestuariibaculum suncheonense TaxID=1028745 RepID=A0A8J6UKU6_9FLAO|nr:DinB family protein [Aestuariibaculum suncheonense]MBD0835981.1 DinB family protein [Aestuariibaculum suncheonense]
MKSIIKTTLKTLEKAEIILSSLTDAQFSDATLPPYFSSIGTHIRHILDFYDCIFNLNSENIIDLTARSRNKKVEQECHEAKTYLKVVIDKLQNYNYDMSKTVVVMDDLGQGKIEIPYTIGALLAQANSHTIHHYAIINYILSGLEIASADLEFGYNPTTPRPATFP